MNEEQAPIDDCWNRTGIHGDRSCERLQEHGHCRHCEVYASAATRLMQRPMPPDYRAAWTRHFAEPEAVERAADESVLVFRVGQEWLTLPARHAILVAEEGKPHRLPHRRGNELHGIVNVRGRLYPCMSLSSLLQIDEHAPAANATANRHQSGSRILVVELGGPVGDRASFEGKGGAVARGLAQRLDLGIAEPWHSARDPIVAFGSLLSLLSGSVGKFGADVALLAQNEVAAITVAGGGGSSAMAHKSNPVNAEVLVALARHNAGLVGTLHQALVHENERSGAAWTLEWLTLPQMLVATGGSLRLALALAEQISFR